MTWLTQSRLKPCDSSQCERSTSLASRFCCHPCGVAWDAHMHDWDVHEPLAHSEGCDERSLSK